MQLTIVNRLLTGAYIPFVYILLVRNSSATPFLLSFFFRTLGSNIDPYLANLFYLLITMPLALHNLKQNKVIKALEKNYY